MRLLAHWQPYFCCCYLSAPRQHTLCITHLMPHYLCVSCLEVILHLGPTKIMPRAFEILAVIIFASLSQYPPSVNSLQFAFVNNTLYASNPLESFEDRAITSLVGLIQTAFHHQVPNVHGTTTQSCITAPSIFPIGPGSSKFQNYAVLLSHRHNKCQR